MNWMKQIERYRAYKKASSHEEAEGNRRQLTKFSGYNIDTVEKRTNDCEYKPEHI